MQPAAAFATTTILLVDRPQRREIKLCFSGLRINCYRLSRRWIRDQGRGRTEPHTEQTSEERDRGYRGY
jgi:hypothetical protein